jgi:hypothetical protein
MQLAELIDASSAQSFSPVTRMPSTSFSTVDEHFGKLDIPSPFPIQVRTLQPIKPPLLEPLTSGPLVGQASFRVGRLLGSLAPAFHNYYFQFVVAFWQSFQFSPFNPYSDHTHTDASD